MKYAHVVITYVTIVGVMLIQFQRASRAEDRAQRWEDIAKRWENEATRGLRIIEQYDSLSIERTKVIELQNRQLAWVKAQLEQEIDTSRIRQIETWAGGDNNKP